MLSIGVMLAELIMWLCKYPRRELSLPHRDVNDVKEYGIGIDVHKLSLWVCVRTRQNGVYMLTTAKFPTDGNSILLTKAWCYEILRTKSDILIDINHHISTSRMNNFDLISAFIMEVP